MKQFTVHLDIPFDGDRNDYLVQVDAVDVQDATDRARNKVANEMEFDSEAMSYCEILMVYPGHIDSLWNRPNQKPI